MNASRIQAIVGVATLVVTLFGGLTVWGITLDKRVAQLEQRMMVAEATVAEDRQLITAQIIDLLKLVHEMRGTQAQITTDDRGPR